MTPTHWAILIGSLISAGILLVTLYAKEIWQWIGN